MMSFGWVPSRVQVHRELLHLDEEQFLAQYPIGKTFQIELMVRVMDQQAFSAVSERIGSVN
jgi:hypothetical protein